MGLELKKGDEITFVVDKSGSMGERDAACGNDTKYHWMKETLVSYVKTALPFTPAGATLVFFSHGVQVYANVTTPEQAATLVDQNHTGGGTNTHIAIEAAWNEHVRRGSKSSFVLIWTDGEASDRAALARQIVDITNKVSGPEEFRITFCPIGTINDDMAAFLNFLDEGLTGAKYDIVAVVKPDEADFEQAIANAIGGTTTQAEADTGDVHGKHTETV